MRRQGWRAGFDGDRISSWALVALVHVALLAWLSRPVAPLLRNETTALQVHWIERTVPPAQMRVPRLMLPPSSPQIPRRAPPADIATRVDPMPPAAPATQPVDSARPLSAVFIEQGRQWAEAQAPVGDFRPDPLRRREDFAGADKVERFRMREPVTVAAVVRGIGTLFGGSDYTTNPCPRVRANLANLGTGGDRALVEEEVRRLRQLCQ